MFCFQCQETAQGKGCTVRGVCGKEPQTAALMDLLLYVVRGVALVNRSLRKRGMPIRRQAVLFWMPCFVRLRMPISMMEAISGRIERMLAVKNRLIGTAKKRGISLPEMPEVNYSVKRDDYITEAAKAGVLTEANEDLRFLKQLAIYGVKGAAAYTEHALNLGFEEQEVYEMIENTLAEVSREDISAEELTSLVLNVGECGVKAMALLDKANTSTYGHPEIRE